MFPSFATVLLLAGAGVSAQDPATGWMAYAVGKLPSGAERITNIEMTWTVGANAKRSSAFYSPWFGMDPADNDNLLQPVNPWEGSSWAMYTEYYQWSPTRNSNSAAHSVKAGQTLHGAITYNQAQDSYTIKQTIVETGVTSSQVVKSQNGKKFTVPYVVYEKTWACGDYPPDGKVTFRDIKVECDGKDCTSGVEWQAKVKDPNCNMKANIESQTEISITWDTSLASKYDNFTDSELVALNAKGWGARFADKSFAEIATHVNAQATTWSAEVPSRFESMDDVKMLCGTVLKNHKDYKEVLEEKTEQEIPNENIAAEFDVRTGFPKCASVSGHIRDQSACGSCWAFGSTEAFNDRRCIATGDTTLMSAEDTTANCGLLQCFSMGCGGGQPGAAWNWFKSTGVVTGGDYEDIGKGDTCGPYSLKACAHHVPATSKYPVCPKAEYSTPTLKSCDKSYSKSYSADKKKASASYSLSGISKIQSDIQQHGSVTAAFTVYGDFPTYKSGVYKHVTGSQLGGHAVKILGWGTESGQDYWLVANSWNEQWGDHGLFKIARGTNECGIESQISAGTVSADAVVVV